MARDPLAFVPKVIAAGLTDRRMTLRALGVLVEVERKPRCSVREIATALGMPRPSVTRAAQSLREIGLVTVTRQAVDDERLVSIALTDKGQETLQALRAAA